MDKSDMQIILQLLSGQRAWKLLNSPRLIFFELPLCLLPVLFLVSIMEKPEIKYKVSL